MDKVVVKNDDDPKFMVWFLKRKSRIKFLSMAVRHDFFKRNKDIRRYIAKWFFFEHVDILPRLIQLGVSNYGNEPGFDVKKCIINDFNLKAMLDWEEDSNVFNKFCHTYLFQRLYKSNLFWGVRIIGLGLRPIPSTVYLSFFGFERVVKDNYPEELHGLRSNVITQLQVENISHLSKKSCSEIDKELSQMETDLFVKKIKKHKPN